MKRMLSISLAVLLVAGLSIMIFPAQTVEAQAPGGTNFHIQAEGEAEYQFAGSEWQTGGDFFINVTGQKGYGNKWTGYSYYHRLGWGPQDTVQGHIRGSFGENEIDVTLTSHPHFGKEVHLDSNGRLVWVGFKFKGTYNGNKVTVPGTSYIRVFYDENGELEYILADLCFTYGTTQTFVDVRMCDASVDLH
jgi:hypothetical protein